MVYILKASKGSYEDYTTWDVKAYTKLTKAEAEKSKLECAQKDEIIKAEEYINNNKNHNCIFTDVVNRYGHKNCKICETIEEYEYFVMDSDEMIGYYIKELELEGDVL